MRPRSIVVTAIVALTALVTGTGAFEGTARATGPTHQVAGSVAAPTTADMTPVCKAPDASSVLGPAPAFPADPTGTVASPPGGVVNFTATTSGIYVNTGSQLITYSLSGAQQGAFSIPAAFAGSQEPSQPVVDPVGNIYLSSYYNQLVDKFSPAGRLLWSVDPEGGNPTGLFSMGSGSGFQLAVSVIQHKSRSDLLNPSTGAVIGTFPLFDEFDYITQEANGNLLVSGDGRVKTVDPTGTVLSSFGSSQTRGNGVHTGSGTQFFYPAQAVQGSDGTIYTLDPLTTIEATSPQGYFLGSTTLGQNNLGGGNLDIGGYNFYLVGSTLYFQGGAAFNNGADHISSIPLATLRIYLDSAHVPYNSLGWGAGLTTAAVGNYFAPGTTPAVSATFDSWWTADAAHLQLSYSVEDTASLTAETVPSPTTVALPTSASGLANVPLAIPTTDLQPGPYLVQASLYDTGTSPPTRIGAACMPYTVGAPGDGLDLASLPAGAGSGGPADPRGVALEAQLGVTGQRALAFSWSNFLPNCSAGAPSAATCGPSAMNFANAPTSYFKAAALARADHVSFWVQIGGGDPVSPALVSGGWWQADIQALVSYYANPPATCGACAPVTMWEPWNESNNTGWGSAANYVSQVLRPFYAAVKAVEPGSQSTVIGGSTLEPSVWWWQQLVSAGGLGALDVAAIHPYTGNNDSFEEDGMQTQVQQLEGVLQGKPLWFTELGWWSDGDYNFLGQANTVARSMIWQKVLHIPVWNYFFSEGSWGNDGVSFSLIQSGDTDDYVKPAALGAMVAAGQIANRPYLTMPATGIPQTYEATFGAATGGGTQLAAVWSDGLSTTGTVSVTAPGGGTVPVTVTSEYGTSTTVAVASGASYGLPISDQVTYLAFPVGDSLTVGPCQVFGADVATSSAGATATASSGDASASITGSPLGNGWHSAPGDATPSLSVTLARATTVNRVIVDTQSVGSTATSVRNYTVSVDQPGVGWTTVATVVGQYRTHQMLLAFDPIVAVAVRISVSEVNFGGYYGGGVPPWWTPTDTGVAFLHALQVFGGSGSPAQVSGSSLSPLTAGGPGTPMPPTTTPPTTAPPPAPAPAPAPAPVTTPTTSPAQPTAPPYQQGVGPEQPGGSGGYRLAGGDGRVLAFGSASSYGSLSGRRLASPIVGMASMPDAKGYRLVASDGGVFSFGSARFFGSTGALHLNQPIVGIATTVDGQGYWLVASDGGIFAFGDARFYGSAGAIHLNRPIVGMATAPGGKGYWLVASDGGIFAFGDARFYGSAGSLGPSAPTVAIS